MAEPRTTVGLGRWWRLFWGKSLNEIRHFFWISYDLSSFWRCSRATVRDEAVLIQDRISLDQVFTFLSSGSSVSLLLLSVFFPANSRFAKTLSLSPTALVVFQVLSFRIYSGFMTS